MRITDFSVGRKWRCEREERPHFTFLIVGNGSKPGWKRCLIIPDKHFPSTRAADQPLEQEYSHRHIKKCARLLPLDLDDLVRAIYS